MPREKFARPFLNSSLLKCQCFLITLLFISFSTYSTAQKLTSAYVDSIISVALSKNTSDKKFELHELCRKIQGLNPPEALLYFEQVEKGTENDIEALLTSYLFFGPNLSNNGMVERSKKIRRKGLRLAKEIGDPDFQFDYNQSLSSLYINLSIPDSATFYANEADKIALDHSEKFGHLRWQIFQRKADIQGILGNYGTQATLYEKAWESISKYPENKSRGFLLYVLTDFFREQRNFEKQTYYTGLLVEYYNKKKINTPDYHFPIESVLLSENSPEAIKDLKRVITLSDSLNNYNALSAATLTLAKALIKNDKGAEALPYLKHTITKLENANYNLQNSQGYELLQQAYLNAGDYKNAYEALAYQKTIEDSLRSENMISKIADYEVKYDTERKERELEKQATSKKVLYILLVSGTVLLGIISFFLLKNRKKNRLLARQKEMLEVTIDEKNTLLKETHHRVKNSFQIVSSLLYLQSENINDKEAQVAIREAQNRVRSMVLIHQKLYNKDQLVGIDTKEYFEDLTKDIFESHQFTAKKIQYSLDVTPMILDIETITPIGLILNELITNVLKHAFTEVDEKSRMNIQFNRKGEELYLAVQDNGKGMTAEIKESSFGIKLMKALAKKLKATLQIESPAHEGTLATLHIKRFTLMS